MIHPEFQHLSTKYLHTLFLPKYNTKFTRKPKVEGIAYRPIPEGMDLGRIFSIKEKRHVHGDNTTNYKARKCQILPTETRFGFAKAKGEVQKHLDGTIHIFWRGKIFPLSLLFLKKMKDMFLLKRKLCW